MASERGPELAEVIRRAVEFALSEMHVGIPGRIVKYDEKTQKADVQPLVKHVYLDEEGNRQVKSWPVVCNVPVQFPGGGGYALTFPVKADKDKGDTCMLLHADLSIDRWLSGSGDECDPEIDHMHTMSDAVALIGIRPFGSGGPLSSATSDSLVLAKDDGTSSITMKDSKITVAIKDKATVVLDGDDVIVNGGSDKVLTEKSKTQTKNISYPSDITAIAGQAGPYPFVLSSATAVIPQLSTTSGSDHLKAKG